MTVMFSRQTYKSAHEFGIAYRLHKTASSELFGDSPDMMLTLQSLLADTCTDRTSRLFVEQSAELRPGSTRAEFGPHSRGSL